MTNNELTKIREEKKLSKSDFAKLLGISPMLLGKYEKGSVAIPENIVEKLQAASDAAAATEVEVKKTVRKGGRKSKEVLEETAAVMKYAAEDQAVVAEIEVKKATRKAGRKAKEVVKKAAADVKEAVSGPNIIVQSPMGGYISTEDIVKRVPKDAADIYVRVDENKLYYVLKNGESGSVDIWD